MRLGAPLRGLAYGIGVVVGVPLSWTAGKPLAAVIIGGIAIVGMGLEVAAISRRRNGP